MSIEFKELEEEYAKYEKKYKLPSFKELNNDFEIDKLDKISGNFVKSIRKTMMDKIVNTLGFLEMMLNPMNAPRMYAVYLNTMGQDDRNKINKMYGVLAGLIVDSLDLEIEYDEKEESEVIKKIFGSWKDIKGDLKQILKNMRNPKEFQKKEKNYFG
ncbi:hypothetical protein CMI45_02245 [Candidatus Pacearchaeota archaeon]|jgi:hypothetical protein|nr:hypothetical protein [Candidatus Pacearchaeota archaeon]|tara:strand:- start:240 stop:710 length:471 start_codon:yes stop_codon:yes gene_type:complete